MSKNKRQPSTGGNIDRARAVNERKRSNAQSVIPPRNTRRARTRAARDDRELRSYL